jgi:hypothetical protein
MTEYREVEVERRGSGATAILAMVAVVVIAIAAYFMLRNDTRETDAISGAAKDVSQAAERVADAPKGE